jgi:HEAT repeat protein
MNTITLKCATLVTASVVSFCAALCAEESIQQKAGALIARQDVTQLAQMCEHALRPGADQERAELCKTIIAHVQREDVPPVVKGELLTLLGRFGGPESVEFLAGLLSHADPLFRTRAVLGLQQNPPEEAAASLRKALAGASEPEKRAALIHALSLRGDRASLPQFIKDAAGAEDAVRTAALLAIASLADEPANALFKAGMKQGPATARREATNAYLLHADRLAKIGKKQEALGVYHELVGESGYAKAAALLGMARAGGAAELTAILENLKGAERCVIDVTGPIFEHIPKSGPVVAAVCENVKTAAPPLKVRLLDVLARYADPAGLATVLEAANDANPAVRAAAVSALGRFDDRRASDALVAALAGGKETAAALRAVEMSPMKPVLADGLIAALPGASGPRRVSLVQALRACPADKVVPVLLKTAEDADPAVRSEAFVALRAIGDPSAYPRLVERLAEEPSPQAQLVGANALAALGARIKEPSQRTAPVLARLAAGSSPGRPALLLALPRLSTEATQEAGLKFVREALHAQDEKLRRAAIQALGDWPDPDPVMDELLQASQKEPKAPLGVLALRAYCKQIGALMEKRNAAVREKRIPAEDAQREIVRRCTQGMEVAVQPAERMGFLGHLGQQPHPGALKAVAGCLDDPNVRKEAIQAAWSIASALHKTHPDAVKPVLERIKMVTEDKQWQSRVDQLLKTMEAKK